MCIAIRVLQGHLTISVEEDESEGHEQRMPVELVIRVVLEREAAQEVAGPDAHQHHRHETGHLHS